MTKSEAIFLYIGTYPDEATARADYDVLKDLHMAEYVGPEDDGAANVGTVDVGSYDAAVITKDASGKVHVNQDEMATRHGGLGGVLPGRVIGILFPPSIIGTAIVGGAVGGVCGHLWRGLSRTDVKDLGELIDDGEAALLVVGGSGLEAKLANVPLNADKHLGKVLDVSSKDLDAAVKEAASEVS